MTNLRSCNAAVLLVVLVGANLRAAERSIELLPAQIALISREAGKKAFG
jgi:hypothetical protein